MWSADELIAACATPPGRGARSVVRLAGDGLDSLLGRLFEPVDVTGCTAPADRARVVATRLAGDLAEAWGPLPVTLLSWPGPAGPIGGPLAEVQLPCSAPLVEAVVAEACRNGARPARGGEFTLRAFLSGRLDLLQAEAVLAVVDARSPGELAGALDRMAGGAGERLRRLRDELLDVLADIEAAIDFADEATPDAVPMTDTAAWRVLAERIERMRAALLDLSSTLPGRGVGEAGLPRVVLSGAPNVGKSSLFNALAGREAALVADGAGTTRDWLEARLDLPLASGGTVACVLVDVAGVETASEERGPSATHEDRHGDPAMHAIAAARCALAVADVVVECHDAAAGSSGAAPSHVGRGGIAVWTRCDRGWRDGDPDGRLATSSRTGIGLDALRDAIAVAVASLPPRGSPATVRLAAGLDAAARALEPAGARVVAAGAGTAVDEALLAGHLRAALEALDEVTGARLGPELLDRIFSRHCIGK